VNHVAIVLPGRSYGPDMAGLAIPIAIMRERGAHVVVAEYLPDPWPDWRRVEAGDWSEITDVLAPRIEPALAQADRVTLIAKSMGTSVISGLSHLFPTTTEAIWLTPLFADPDVRRDVIAKAWRCLSVFATDDASRDPEGQARVTEACKGVELALENVGHGMAMSDAQAQALRDAVVSFCR